MRFKRFILKRATFPGERMRLLKFNLVKNSLIDEQAGRHQVGRQTNWSANMMSSKLSDRQT